MPAPSPSEIESLANAALQSAGLRGQNVPALAGAFGMAIGQALSMFVSMAMIAPGIPASAPPPGLSGSTVGPGKLLPPPSGGPNASMLEPLAMSALQAKQLRGQNIPQLGKAIAQTLEVAITMFTSQVMVAPGIAISGLVTSAPGSLIGAAPTRAVLQSPAMGFLAASGIQGQHAKDLAGALADTIANAFTQTMSRLKVLPGIPCTPAATAGPGRLI